MTDTIQVDGTYTVAADTQLSFVDEYGFNLVAGSPSPSLIIDGQVSVVGDKHAVDPLYGAAAFGDQSDTGASVQIDAGGVLAVRGKLDPVGVYFGYDACSFSNDGSLLITGDSAFTGATGIEDDGAGASIANGGVIRVTAGGAATGIAASLYGGAQVSNTGKISVNGGAGGAQGIELGDGASLDSSGSLRVVGHDTIGVNGDNDCTVTNSGSITVISAGHADQAVGVAMTSGAFTNHGDITATGAVAQGLVVEYVNNDIFNDGDITAVASSAHGLSYGVNLQSGSIGTTNIDNGGLISADVAIQVFDVLASARSIDLTNSGRIEGAVDLGYGADHVTNTGTIVGAVSLGAGDDVYDGSGGSLSGMLSGGDGNDLLIGDTGANVIYGGAGGDTMTGGGGADDFVFHSIKDSKGEKDLITDLTNSDTIDVSHIDADTTLAGNQAFVLVSSFDGHAGEILLIYHPGSDTTTLEADVNGDGRPDMEVILSGDHHDFTNFVL